MGTPLFSNAPDIEQYVSARFAEYEAQLQAWQEHSAALLKALNEARAQLRDNAASRAAEAREASIAERLASALGDPGLACFGVDDLLLRLEASDVGKLGVP